MNYHNFFTLIKCYNKKSLTPLFSTLFIIGQFSQFAILSFPPESISSNFWWSFYELHIFSNIVIF